MTHSATAEEVLARWNTSHPVGCVVFAHRATDDDLPPIVRARTASKAWVSPDGVPLVTVIFDTPNVLRSSRDEPVIVPLSRVTDSPPVISSFTGEHRFLSNFHPAVVVLDDVEYPTVEHAYQAAKTRDAAHRALIRAARTPGAAKRLGKTAPLRADWDGGARVDVMLDLVWQKFGRDDLRALLLATGDATLIEGNTWGDVFWGTCRGVGSNLLGRILMAVREARRASGRRPDAERVTRGLDV